MDDVLPPASASSEGGNLSQGSIDHNATSSNHKATSAERVSSVSKTLTLTVGELITGGLSIVGFCFAMGVAYNQFEDAKQGLLELKESNKVQEKQLNLISDEVALLYDSE